MNAPTGNLPPVDQFAQNAQEPAGGGDGPDAIKLQNAGEYVYGIVTAARYGFTTPHGDGHIIEMDDQQRGPVALWCTSAQLRNGIVEGQNQAGRPVQAGDLVYIRFDGKKNLDGGKTLNTYSINVQAPGGNAQAQAQQTSNQWANGQPAQQGNAAPF